MTIKAIEIKPVSAPAITNNQILNSVNSFNSCTSIDELIELWKTIFHELGFDYLFYSRYCALGTPEKKPYRKWYASNVPEEIQQRFFNEKTNNYDPVLKYVFSTVESLWLSDAVNLPYFQDKAPKAFLEKSLDAVEDAICIPVTGANFMKGYFVAAYAKKASPKDKIFVKGSLDNWHILGLAHLLHIRYCKLFSSMQIKIQLTKRETEVLQHLVAGQTNREIGTHLDISINTVNTYLKNIFMKMNTKDRVSTAIKAYALDLITHPRELPKNLDFPERVNQR